jgi:hypothetical protein
MPDFTRWAFTEILFLRMTRASSPPPAAGLASRRNTFFFSTRCLRYAAAPGASVTLMPLNPTRAPVSSVKEQSSATAMAW